jgi:hypothetical protein
MQAIYPLKIQAIRSKGQQARLYVYFPLPLAAAIGLQAGEEVQWELLDCANYIWFEPSCLSSKPLKGQVKAAKLLRPRP